MKGGFAIVEDDAGRQYIVDEITGPDIFTRGKFSPLLSLLAAEAATEQAATRGGLNAFARDYITKHPDVLDESLLRSLGFGKIVSVKQAVFSRDAQGRPTGAVIEEVRA